SAFQSRNARARSEGSRPCDPSPQATYYNSIDKAPPAVDDMTTHEGAVMDLAVWLWSLGLGQYEAAFRENAITEKVLPRLTAEDLKDLGVSIVGHRRVLICAQAPRRTLKRFFSKRGIGQSSRRAPPSYGDVLRLGGLNGALGSHGPRRTA